jgi:hypothetical protein
MTLLLWILEQKCSSRLTWSEGRERVRKIASRRATMD